MAKKTAAELGNQGYEVVAMRIQVPNEPNTQYDSSDPSSSDHALGRVERRVISGLDTVR